MGGLLSDVRKTAMGAAGLLVVAVLVADPSGLGGSVASEEGDALAAPEAGAAQTPAPSAGSWFAEDSAEPAAPITVRPAARPPVQPAMEAAAGTIYPPGPVGPDFPPQLTRRVQGG